MQMLINLEDFDGNRTAILVNEFRIANEDSGYRIFYKNFSSPVGRSLPARGTKFRYFFSMFYLLSRYSRLSNKRTGLIKRTGWKFFPKSISVQALINVQGRNFSKAQ